MRRTRRLLFACAAMEILLAGSLAAGAAFAQGAPAAPPAAHPPAAPAMDPEIAAMLGLPPPKPDLTQYPWLDPSKDPDQRADMVIAQMTLDEKIALVHGSGFGSSASNGGAGYVPGVPRLKIPALNMADSTLGVARGAARSRYSTLMPATIGEAASWDPQVAYDYGALIGRELRDQGYNVTLAGGVDLMREPRNGRNFEYRGEDPLLAGTMVAHAIQGLQAQHVIGDIKHYALNDQETGRQIGNVVIDYTAARESDLLAFEIGVREGQPGMVMCSYNKVNGDWSCENDTLLNRTLKQEWGFKGWVLSDWGGTHSTEKAIRAGLDQEQPGQQYFGQALKDAVQSGKVPQAMLDQSVHRILRTMFASGIVDDPPREQVVDVDAGREISQRTEEQAAVLLKNTPGLLPFAENVHTVAVIGGHADVGVITGGGSGQVDPPGGNAVKEAPSAAAKASTPFGRGPVWWPDSPLRALEAAAPQTHFVYDDGTDPARAAAVAHSADMAIIYAYKPASEGADSPTLALPDNQDALISSVAQANGKTVVVLETGGPVTMPWVDQVGAVVESWFPGERGGEAIADLLTGRANFSAKLPATFPRSEADLPHPVTPGSDLPTTPNPRFPQMRELPPFDIPYTEGVLVGYKWYQAKGKTPLFAFGHGLSYTTYAYSDLHVTPTEATFSITNTGPRAGAEIAEVYAALPADVRPAPRQLVGWAKVELQPGQTRQVTVEMKQVALSIYDDKARGWREPNGTFEVFVGGASDDTPLKGSFIR